MSSEMNREVKALLRLEHEPWAVPRAATSLKAFGIESQFLPCGVSKQTENIAVYTFTGAGCILVDNI